MVQRLFRFFKTIRTDLDSGGNLSSHNDLNRYPEGCFRKMKKNLSLCSGIFIESIP
jgi:hypothetical protein